MESFERLFRHNAWANTKVVDCALAAPIALTDAALPIGGSMTQVAAHIAETEEAFLLVFKGTPDYPQLPETLPEVAAYLRARDEALIAFAAAATAESLAAEVFVPWFERAVPVAECLRQLIGHCNQHRAELAWELARAGIDTGEIDYIMWYLDLGV